MRRRRKLPSYRLHRPSGQAVVTLSGRDFYLGEHGSEISRVEYDRVVAEWLAAGRRLSDPEGESALTVNELLLGYWEFAQGYYVRDGKPSAEQCAMKQVLRVVKRLYGHTRAAEFGPLALKACREEFLGAGQPRQKINQNVGRIRRVFRWAVENELVPSNLFHGLQAVRGLRRGKTEAPESEGVKPIPREHVEAVLRYVSAAVAGMIRVQLLTGMRPGEVVIMRGQDIDRSGRVWIYRPAKHKTEHHGHERLVHIGPKGQAALRPFLEGASERYLFSPRRAEEARNAKRRIARRTPMTPSQAGRKRKARPERSAGEHYAVRSYRQAIVRACEKAEVPPWHPHQLRHNAATELRKEFGIEAARVVLGHRSAAVTEIYAEMDNGKAAEVMAKVG